MSLFLLSTVNHISDNSKEDEESIYPDACHFCCWSFIPVVPGFPMISSPFHLKNLVFILKQMCWQQSLNFPSSEDIFISPAFLKDIFTTYRTVDCQFFSFRASKTVSLPFRFHGFWGDTDSHSNKCSPTDNVLFLWLLSRVFSLSLI